MPTDDPAKDEIEALRRQLQAPSPRERHRAARALAGLGERAVAALPELIGLFSDGDLRVRETAVVAVARLGRLAVPALLVVIEALRGMKDKRVPLIYYLNNGAHLLREVAALPVDVVSVD